MPTVSDSSSRTYADRKRRNKFQTNCGEDFDFTQGWNIFYVCFSHYINSQATKMISPRTKAFKTKIKQVSELLNNDRSDIIEAATALINYKDLANAYATHSGTEDFWVSWFDQFNSLKEYKLFEKKIQDNPDRISKVITRLDPHSGEYEKPFKKLSKKERRQINIIGQVYGEASSDFCKWRTSYFECQGNSVFDLKPKHCPFGYYTSKRSSVIDDKPVLSEANNEILTLLEEKMKHDSTEHDVKTLKKYLNTS